LLSVFCFIFYSLKPIRPRTLNIEKTWNGLTSLTNTWQSCTSQNYSSNYKLWFLLFILLKELQYRILNTVYGIISLHTHTVNKRRTVCARTNSQNDSLFI
jgi:hypothetical protein